MFSQTSEYALRAVVWLAEHRSEGPVGNKRIAADTQVPASYLSKILHDLASAGFLSSRRGVGGGFQLIVSPKSLTMLDVINAVDPLKRVKFCAHADGDSVTRMCPMHQRLDTAIGMVEKMLGDTTIHDVTKQSAVEHNSFGSRLDGAHNRGSFPPAASTLPSEPVTHRRDSSPLVVALSSSGTN